jgi:hypothetical protein
MKFFDQRYVTQMRNDSKVTIKTESMKKLIVILFASMALAACGGQGSEASRDETDDYETNSPEATPQDNSREGMDTTGTDMGADTTKSGGTTGSASGSGLDGSDTNGIEDESANATDESADGRDG